MQPACTSRVSRHALDPNPISAWQSPKPPSQLTTPARLPPRRRLQNNNFDDDTKAAIEAVRGANLKELNFKKK